ncbi:MAG: alpha/beta hydrolase [Gammaproteobacteria bacterium]|jgi:pimeloyl-ACP methyl ester carboxylesterase|nr:alpha/beta hydrolase [Gammaproteobacteria bacterium]
MKKCFVLWLLVCAQPLSAAEIESETVVGGAGLPLQVISAGDPGKPEILFIHGFSLSSSSWTQQFEALADDYRLVAFDLRGHGNSAQPWEASGYADTELWADDVAAVIAATGLKRPTVVAWSYGGHVTLDYIRKYGTAKLAGLLLSGSSAGMLPFPPPDPETAKRFKRQTQLSLSANSGDRFEAAHSFVTGMVVQPLSHDIIHREVAAAVLLTPRVRIAMQGRSLDNADLKAKLTLPVLFVVGSQDRSATFESITALAPELPDAAVSFYDETGHMPFIEREARFNDEVKRFVASGLASFKSP